MGKRMGYHRRSLAKTAIFRLKTLFSTHLKNHRFQTQTTQAYARLAAMNIMTRRYTGNRRRPGLLNTSPSAFIRYSRFMQQSHPNRQNF